MKLAICSIFIAAIAFGCSGDYNKAIKDEVELDVYEFQYEGHEYLVFTNNIRIINVIHSPSCCSNNEMLNNLTNE